jgi:hypothetical protein
MTGLNIILRSSDSSMYRKEYLVCCAVQSGDDVPCFRTRLETHKNVRGLSDGEATSAFSIYRRNLKFYLSQIKMKR